MFLQRIEPGTPGIQSEPFTIRLSHHTNKLQSCECYIYKIDEKSLLYALLLSRYRFGVFWASFGRFLDISHRSGNGTNFLNDLQGIELNITGPICWVGIFSQMHGFTL